MINRHILLFLSMILFLMSSLVLLSNYIITLNVNYGPVAITLQLLSNLSILSVNIKKNIVFVFLQLTFFLFLISGPLITLLDGEDFFSLYNSYVVYETYMCYWISVFSMWLFFVSKLVGKNVNNITFYTSNSQKTNDINLEKLKRLSKALFYVCISANALLIIDKIIFRQAYSLQEYYALYNSSSHLPLIIVKTAECHLMALFLYLATLPSKKEVMKIMYIFLGVTSLTIFYGVRNVIVLNILIFFLYFVYRDIHSRNWINKRKLCLLMSLSPLLLMLLQAFDSIRRSIGFSAFDIKEFFSLELLKNFFISQSVSSYILPNAISNLNLLGEQPVPYSLGVVYTYLKQNMVVRMFTGEQLYTSNSFEAAMNSGNLGSRLAYYLYRESFLNGTGMGGSFIADLYIDFSYLGVLIGTIVLCYIISYFQFNMTMATSPISIAFTLLAIRWLIYIPRDSFFSWLIQTFSIMNVAYVFLVVVLLRCKVR